MNWFGTNFLKLIFLTQDFFYTFYNHKFLLNRQKIKFSVEETFHARWQKLNKSKWIKLLIAMIFNPYGKNPRDLLFYHFFKFYKDRFNQFIPTIKLSRDSSECFKRIIDTQTLIIIVATHNGYSFATKLISEKKNVTVLHGGRSGKTIRNTFALSGIKKDIPTISADRYCFAKMLENVKENLVYVCCIDERSKNTRKFSEINPNIFEFAIRFQLPVFFYQDSVNENAEVIASFYKPSDIKTAEDYSSQFISFLSNGGNYKLKQENKK